MAAPPLDFSSTMDRHGISYTPRLFPGVIHKEKESLHLFLHPDRPRWAIANAIGWEIVQLCDGTRDVASIASVLSERYNQDDSIVIKDVQAFLGSLDRAGLLQSGDGESGGGAEVDLRGIFIHITDRCNLKCIHCYAGSGAGGRDGLESGKIHGLIDEHVARGGRAITISGGEPLLRADWHEILEHACESLKATVNTNGTLITRESAALFARLRPYVQISLDGPSAEVHDRVRGRGTFDATLRGIRLLQDAGMAERLIVSMTLMKHNIGRAPEMLSFIEKLAIPKLRFLPLHSQGRARSSWSSLDASVDQYLEWYDHVYYGWEPQAPTMEVSGGLTGFLLYMPAEEGQRWCGIGNRIVVDTKGDVYPCSLLMDEQFLVGNVNDMSLRDIEMSKRLSELTALCVSRKDRIEACRSCEWKGLCQSACPALSFLERGTFLVADEYCTFRQRLYNDKIFEVAGARKSFPCS
jgi:radical SAM protein with 4Fe4S-binding SPASM domain